LHKIRYCDKNPLNVNSLSTVLFRFISAMEKKMKCGTLILLILMIPLFIPSVATSAERYVAP
jgi:hypothetical protein